MTDLPDAETSIPDEAVEAATEALDDCFNGWERSVSMSVMARVALTAALPLLAEHWATRIEALAAKWQQERDSFDTTKPDHRVDAAVTRIHIYELRALVRGLGGDT